MRPLALALALSLLACRPRDDTDPETWMRRLDDRDAKVRVQAVQQLRKLKAKRAAPEVAALLKDPLVKEDAALALEDLGGRGQVDALLDAVDTTVGAGSDAAARAANRTNARIAEALGNIGDPRAGPASTALILPSALAANILTRFESRREVAGTGSGSTYLSFARRTGTARPSSMSPRTSAVLAYVPAGARLFSFAHAR